MNDAFSVRRVAFALAGAVTVILAGTLLFHRFTNSTRPISVLLVLAGLTIFAFIATILVEGIAGAGGYRRVVYLPHRNDVVEFLAREVRERDLVITMGCGDVWMLGDAALERIREAS